MTLKDLDINLRRRNFIKLSVFSVAAFILGKISAPFLTSNNGSNLAQVGVVGPPTTPTGLVATPVSSSQVNLSWTPSTDNTGVANYKVYRQLGLPTTPPPPPGTPPTWTIPASMKFTSVTRILVDSVNGPKAPSSGLKRVGLGLHGAGGNESIHGDLYHGQCGASLGGNDDPIQVWRVKNESSRIVIVPRDPGRSMTDLYPDTAWFGWGPTVAGPISPYTERRLLAILDWARNTYPYLDWGYVNVSGNSMGAIGGVFMGGRHPDIFSKAGGSAPRWKVYGATGWTGYYRNFKKYSTASDAIDSPIAMADGSDYEAYGNIIGMISDTSRDVPFFSWNWAWDDGLGMGRTGQVEAINALRAAKRGFVTAWSGGGHSGAGLAQPLINATYDNILFKLGGGYPILSNSSLDDDPTNTTDGGINLGFEWRSVAESSTGFSFELRQRNANCTVTVMPFSKLYSGRSTKNLTLTKDVWQTVLFGVAPGPIPPPPPPPPPPPVIVPPPVITKLTVDGVGAIGGADLLVTVNTGQTVTISWQATADSFTLEGKTEPLSGSKQWTAPTVPGVIMIAANADRIDGQTTAKLIYFTVKAVVVPPPPPPPPSGALPVWLAGKAIKEWVTIPNSQLTARNPVYAVDDTYFDTYMGLPRPSLNSNQVTWGTNKYGIKWARTELYDWGHRTTESGMSFDDRRSRIYIGGGDAFWADNSYQEFDYSLDSPLWRAAVIRPSHHKDFKNPIYGSDPYEYPTLQPGDDDRKSKMYDGRHRGGHSYHCQTFFRARNWLCHFGSHQYWPIDLGGSPEVAVADLTTGDWVRSNPGPIPDIIKDEKDNHPWKAKHPITEDFYLWLGDRVAVLRQASLTYETLLIIPEYKRTLYDSMRLSGSIDWTHGEILFAGRILSDPHQYWTMSLNAPYTRTVVTIVGPHAAAFTPNRNGGIWWNPDLQQHLYYKDDSFVYTITRSGATEFTVDRLGMMGTPPIVDEIKNNKAGGVLNNFQYDFKLRGMVLRVADQRLMRFFRTG